MAIGRTNLDWLGYKLPEKESKFRNMNQDSDNDM